ncbi:hypothetical protein NKR23_g6603 [Pleurostoma richardsiae]|uniref:Zn(2)-C6 fungal-type domain-containing protein n=1 Tax=Pleurostoma richardsiae TaxID=41990 RepID=A0AA38RYU5_9PEZI|nr:hypothetical protein NKR23_g6603 [Pleurostoma richardsiae]
MATSSEVKGCDACRERKLRCDKGRPVCTNCRRSKRDCVTQSFRLSWPRARDRRRLVIGPGPATASRTASSDPQHFLNVTFGHVKQYHALSDDQVGLLDINDDIERDPVDEILRNPSALHIRLNTVRDGSRTLSYFYSVASDSLPSLAGLRHGFRDLLMKMALLDDGPSSRAVLFSVLSLATLHQAPSSSREAIDFKSRTLQALKESAERGNLTLARVMQHMAAAVLLCRIEIALHVESTTLWCLFVCGVHTLLQGARHFAPQLLSSEDSRLLYKHVHYHSSMASFSLRHWRRPDSLDASTKVEFNGRMIAFKCRRALPIPKLLDCVSEECQLLWAVLELRSRPNEDYHSEGHQAALNGLEARISATYSNLTAEVKEFSNFDSDSMSEVWNLVEKRFVVAASWIYLLRTERRLSGPSEIVLALLRDAFDDDAVSIRHLVHCNLPWPIFIIGAEVSSEEHRRILLDLIHRTVSSGNNISPTHSEELPERPTASFETACELLETVWAMEDLHVENDTGRYLDYEQKLHLAFTASRILPALA